jgi:DNA-binding NarL/FixJ family response regulator
MPRILLADDHAAMRRSMRDLLESHQSLEVCAEAETGLQAVALTAATRPDIVVLDLSMPELDGLQAAQQIHEQFPETLVVMLTAHDPLELSDISKEAGVRICLSKTNVYQLIEAVEGIWQENRKHSNGAPLTARKNAAPPKE